MYIIQSYSAAVICCIVTMFCWGSWANTQKLAAGSWRFELFYWDYVLGILLFSLILAFTLGSMGDSGRSFVADISQASGRNIGSAIVGGIVFNAANILLGAAIAIAGMAVAFPVGIGLALVIGVVVNYLAHPVGKEGLLAGGVSLIVVAILLNAYAYGRMRRAGAMQKAGAVQKAGAPATGKGSGKGLMLAVVAGVLMGFFYKYVAASMFADFSVPEAGKLSPYSAVVVFSAGILLSNFVFNTLLMRRPFVGEPVAPAAYFKGGFRDHITGILGGAVWCLGMSLNILASGKAGPAISYGLGQGATIIAALWGIFIWKEFKGAPKGTGAVLGGMLILYVVGLGLLVYAGA